MAFLKFNLTLLKFNLAFLKFNLTLLKFNLAEHSVTQIPQISTDLPASVLSRFQPLSAPLSCVPSVASDQRSSAPPEGAL